MRPWLSAFIGAGVLIWGPPAFASSERVAAKGKVLGAGGSPLDNSIVMVYSAGVKKGYSLFCPTCYTDCGKRGSTDSQGAFAISGLSPDLLFTFLVARNGYAAQYINNVDPSAGPLAIVLKPRPPIRDSSQVFRGKLVNTGGSAVRGALVTAYAVTLDEPGRGPIGSFDPAGWIDAASMTDDQGEFEMAYSKPALEMTLRVAPRGLAPIIIHVQPGPESKTITVNEGVLIRGRLMYKGKPVADAEIGMTPRDGNALSMYPEVRIGVRDDGTFAFTNVPVGRIWRMYPKMESLASRDLGGQELIFETKYDKEDLDFGDIQLTPGHRIRGKVVLPDGGTVPPNMKITLGADPGPDGQVTQIAPNGHFEFHGLPPRVYSLAPAIRGYRLADGCWFCPGIEVLIQKDIDDLVIRMEPQPQLPVRK